MSLTDAQKIKLPEEIERVLSEDELTIIFLEHEEKFGLNLYNLITGNSYRIRLVHLIKKLNNKQLINDFITIVSHEYPNFAQDL
ncbi:MAG: hypothetical protein F6K17_43030 [Okeania sp. SIO3C4]|nr:hypothetical protein [Okeania sp. SIO3B3]NER08821.1 hypothetical protein [Okeania sp. SIO3C4]